MEQHRLIASGTDPAPFGRDEIVRRMAARIEQGEIRSGAELGRRLRGDHDFGSPPPTAPLKAAAVLVPIVDRGYGLTVLLTQRTDHLHAHAGQISFPGGRIEPEDSSPEDAALREAEEEVGLPRDHVELVGRLDLYHTATGFEVVPIVGLVRPPTALKPDPFEVAEVFEVPLGFIVDPANHQIQTGERNGRKRSYYVLPYQGRFIWGATAGMLVNLAEVLR